MLLGSPFCCGERPRQVDNQSVGFLRFWNQRRRLHILSVLCCLVSSCLFSRQYSTTVADIFFVNLPKGKRQYRNSRGLAARGVTTALSNALLQLDVSPWFLFTLAEDLAKQTTPGIAWLTSNFLVFGLLCVRMVRYPRRADVVVVLCSCFRRFFIMRSVRFLRFRDISLQRLLGGGSGWIGLDLGKGLCVICEACAPGVLCQSHIVVIQVIRRFGGIWGCGVLGYLIRRGGLR